MCSAASTEAEMSTRSLVKAATTTESCRPSAARLLSQLNSASSSRRLRPHRSSRVRAHPFAPRASFCRPCRWRTHPARSPRACRSCSRSFQRHCYCPWPAACSDGACIFHPTPAAQRPDGRIEHLAKSTISQQRFTLSRVRMFRKQSVPERVKKQ